jgi:hypothetical protein
MRKNRKGGFMPKTPQQSDGIGRTLSEKEELICDATSVFQVVQEQVPGPTGHILGAFIEQIGDTAETIGKARKILDDKLLLANFIKLQKTNYNNEITESARALENKRLEIIEMRIPIVPTTYSDCDPTSVPTFIRPLEPDFGRHVDDYFH